MGAQTPTTAYNLNGSPCGLLAVSSTVNCLVTLPQLGTFNVVHLNRDISDTATPATSLAGDILCIMDNATYVATNNSHGYVAGDRRFTIFPGGNAPFPCQLFTPDSTGARKANLRSIGSGGVLVAIVGGNPNG